LDGWKQILSLGTAVGLGTGPWLGLALIKIAHVAYLETRFALNRMAWGLLIGFTLGTIGTWLLRERVPRLKNSSILGLLTLGIIINIAQTVLLLRRIIP
jgi:hypothetical protein